jgi:carboxypeptidase Q
MCAAERLWNADHADREAAMKVERFRQAAGRVAWSVAFVAAVAAPAAAQTYPTDDPVIRAIWEEGTRNSQLERLAQVLTDSVGPRLTGSPGIEAAAQWALRTYRGWGIQAENQRYGTWRQWRRGIDHIHLVSPRVRSMDGGLLAWTPGTGGREIEAPAVLLPAVSNPAEFEAWLPQARGRWVLVSFPEPTCRPDYAWRDFALPATFERMVTARDSARAEWQTNALNTGLGPGDMHRRLEQAGAVGIITLSWPNGYGARRVFNGRTERVPTFDLSCEDYGLVARLAANGQNPVVRAFGDAEFLGEVPVFNTIARIPGRELPNEYVVLSAHFDSWDGGSGATDNGTGTITMMEAMRILRAVYPNPKRTILVGHWNGEEQGLNGSRAFTFDNPEVVQGLQALLNQDNGTGRVQVVALAGFTGAAGPFGRWMSRIPTELSRLVNLDAPGMPAAGGTDHAAFVCHGAPGFNLSSHPWDYFTYTWHTQLDTYDKIVFEEVRHNALLTAMLAYQASEDAERMPRDRRIITPTGQPGSMAAWPECPQPARSWGESPRVR